MDIYQDDKTREILTHDVGLGVGGHRLSGGTLTLRGDESDLSDVKVELQPPRLMGGRRKPPVSFIHLTDEAVKLSMTARRRQR